MLIFKLFFFLAQLWKINNKNELENKFIVTYVDKNASKDWTIPPVGMEGIIKDCSCKYKNNKMKGRVF